MKTDEVITRYLTSQQIRELYPPPNCDYCFKPIMPWQDLKMSPKTQPIHADCVPIRLKLR